MFWLIVFTMDYRIFMNFQAGIATWQHERYICLHSCYIPTKLIYLSELSGLYVVLMLPCFVWPISNYYKGLLVEISNLFQFINQCKPCMGSQSLLLYKRCLSNSKVGCCSQIRYLTDINDPCQRSIRVHAKVTPLKSTC